MQRRVLINVIILLIVLWVSPFIGFVGAFIFGLFQSYRFYEIIIIGVIIDIVYQTSFGMWTLSVPIYTIMGIILFLFSSRIQKRINLYA